MSDEANLLFDLPADVSINIFLKLPVKSLVTCTCVCKTWNSFIKSPEFVSSHLDRSKNGNHLCLFQLCSLPVGTGRDSFFLRSSDLEFSLRERLYFPFQRKYGCQVVASCNGLVCLISGKFHYVPQGLILWNPVIRKSVMINDRFFEPLEAVGLGFDSRTGDYKVVTIIEELGQETSLMVNLYSLKENSWKRLPDVSAMQVRETYRSMVFLNGALHFIALRGWHENPRLIIWGFDLSDEVFHEIMLPRCILDANASRISHPSHQFHLFTCGESLAVSWLKRSIKVMEIWVMKEYGVQGSWAHLSTVRLDDGISVLRDSEITGFVFREDAHVLLSVASFLNNKESNVYLHDLKSQETKKLNTVRKHACFSLGNYVESLVLMDKGDDLSKHYETESGDADATSRNNSSGNADLVTGTSSCSQNAPHYLYGFEVYSSSSDESSDSE